MYKNAITQEEETWKVLDATRLRMKELNDRRKVNEQIALNRFYKLRELLKPKRSVILNK